jgi:hypothetical protein
VLELRPIEFRAWDKRTDQMFENESFLIMGRLMMQKFKNEYRNEIDIANAQGGPLYTFDDPNMIFMQFTGFYDINGDPARKLWEGDIIIDRLGYHGVIYWGKKSGQWRVKFNYNNDATLWSALEQPLAKYAGNVWENPDLVPWYQPYSRHQENGK